MGRISQEAQKMFQEKQNAIKSISETKDLGMTFSNALNNAVTVWTVLAVNPTLNIKEALEDISSLVDFFRSLKEGIKAEMTAEQAAQEANKVFPENKAPEPDKPQQQPPQPPPADKASDAQVKKIFVELQKHKYDKAKHVETASTKLQLPGLKSLNDLTKAQASTLIKILLNE